MHSLYFAHISVHSVQDCLLEELFGRTFHKDLCDTECPLVLGWVEWALWVALGGYSKDLVHVIFERTWHVACCVLKLRHLIRLDILDSDRPELINKIFDAFSEFVA